VIQLFRVRGIPVRIDAGWLVIFALVTWSLAAGYFPHALPARSSATYWIQAVAAAVLLFASVFLHELSHALAARDQGVRVGGITLHIFGGVSQLDAEPPTPRAELLIAVVGPLTSFAIAGLCLAADRFVGGPAGFHALASYLVAINLMVGLFNLVPGFPLDGGRVLRATLWWWTGRLAHATRIASGIGLAVALLLIALGGLRAVMGDVVGGVWLLLIGLFLQQAARSSWDLVAVRTRLEPLRVHEIMTRAPLNTDLMVPLAEAGVALAPEHVVPPDESAWSAFLKLGHTRNGRLAVVEGSALVGVVTQRDLQAVLAANGAGRGAGARRAA
jgi:Zn-dependent protease